MNPTSPQVSTLVKATFVQDSDSIEFFLTSGLADRKHSVLVNQNGTFIVPPEVLRELDAVIGDRVEVIVDNENRTIQMKVSDNSYPIPEWLRED